MLRTPWSRNYGKDKKVLDKGKTQRWRPTTEGLAFWKQRRLEVYLRDAGCCKECGAKLAKEEAHIHHRRALGMGGSRYNPKDERNCVKNLATLCPECHRGKHG